MDTLRKHVIQTLFFLGAILLLGVFEKSLVSIAIYSVLIIFGALLIAWAAESSEIIISEGLALAIVAWLQVFPEFMIEATIAWARDIPNMLSNFTGANRILTGVGWPLVFFTTAFFSRRKNGKFPKEILLGKEHSAEVVFFLAATLYSVVIFFRDSLTVYDSVVMAALYVCYLFFVSRLPHLSRQKSGEMLMGISKKVVSLKEKYIKPVIALMFLLGGAIIFFVADPFYNEALLLSTSFGISTFLFIQWVAPFLSEFPEKTSAFYWASKIDKAPMALMNLISSKLTQWTLLMAMIPIVFSVSSGAISSIPLNTPIAGMGFTVSTELLLTIATSFYASILLLKLRFTWIEALSLFVLWLVQFIWVPARPAIVLVYLGLALIQILVYRKEVTRALTGFKEIFLTHVSKPKETA
ncbi:MAG: hypothetical protein V1494_05840 [Candidatus Diapherotrites archaeon]